MNKRKVKEIIKFSFFKDIQNKWFIIFNVVTLISLLIVMNLGSISSIFNIGKNKDIYNVAILDEQNLIFDIFTSKLAENEKLTVSKITENNYTAENIPEDLIIIESSLDEENIKFSIISKEGIIRSTYDTIVDALTYSRNILIANAYGISENDLEVFQSEPEINRVMLSVDAEDSDTKEYIKLLSSALTYLVATLIFSKLSNEIAQEKQSKSSEYILTTVSAKEYLFAKVFSNIAIIIIQGIFLIAYYYIAALISRMFTVITTDLTISASLLNSAISKDTVIYILVILIYNILNIILLSIIQATLAARTASTSEAGNTMSLLLFIMVGAYVISSIAFDPHTKVNFILALISCLPLLSAFFIPALLVIGQCEIWQIAISLILLIVAIPLAFNVCPKFFKNGILDYTKAKKKKEKEIISEFLVKRRIKELGFVIGLAILIYVGFQAIFSLISSFAFMPLFENIFNETEITLIMQIILQVLSLGTASIFVLAYCNEQKNHNAAKAVISKPKILLITVFLVFTLQIVLSVVLYPALGLDYDIADMFDLSAESSILTKVIAFIAIALTPAIFEELFFRKAVIDFTIQYNKKFALIFSALLFGLLHMNLSQGLFAFLMGLILGAIYIYTNNLKLTMLIHFVNNGISVLAMILPEMWGIVVVAILLILLIIGLVFFIQLFTNKETREKIISFAKQEIPTEKIKEYKYIFYDYTFDISLILVLLMSVITENLLR